MLADKHFLKKLTTRLYKFQVITRYLQDVAELLRK